MNNLKGRPLSSQRCYRHTAAPAPGGRHCAAEGLPGRLLRLPVRPSKRDQDDADLAAKIQAVHEESRGRYGAPRAHAELRRRGHWHGRKRVARPMRQAASGTGQPGSLQVICSRRGLRDAEGRASRV